ncbi:helix-turn-helix domain-containing protein [Paenibacillaceae bacterium WGS1546]|uniref:helix-turn-helix domain-containing protein n=1 Tax=Cohnella sp. WGS1546 TaxID=3366810 RepID=UPI00372D7B6A
MEKMMFTLPEVAKILGITKERAYAVARSGLLPTVRIGRQIRVERQQLDRWIEKGGKGFPGGWRRCR